MIGVIVVVMSIDFLEHFILWQRPVEMIHFAGALGLVVGALAIFLRFRNIANQTQAPHIQSEIPSNSDHEKELDTKK